MNQKLGGLERAANQADLIRSLQNQLTHEQEYFAQMCRDVYDAGANDREISEVTEFSRARIQQYRKGDPRKRKANAS